MAYSELGSQISGDRSVNLPSGFDSTRGMVSTIEVTPDDLPWLKDNVTVNLTEVTLAGSGDIFRLGSIIGGNDTLKEAADNLDDHRSAVANNLLYSHLPDYISPGSRTKKVRATKGNVPVEYFSNPGGQRVYVTRAERFQTSDVPDTDVPTILRVAACDKADEMDVLSELTTYNRKELKRFGGF